MKDKLQPHSIEAEQAVIGCILMDPAATSRCHAAFGYRDVFYDIRHRTIYNAADGLRAAKTSVDTITVASALQESGKLEEIGGIGYLTECAGVPPSSAALDYYIGIVTEKYDLREIIRTCHEVAGEAHQANGESAEFIERARARLGAVASTRDGGRLDGRHTWSQLADLDTDNDPNCLVGRRYICRGHGVWLIGPSGIGKSSLLLQFAASFCLGRRVYGMPPVRPLRCLVVQAENDEGDLGEMVRGLTAGMALDEFEDEAAWKSLSTNLHIRTTTGKTGSAWCAWLREQIEATGAELVFVDPLLSFAGIDVSRQDQCSQFLRVHLDPVLRETQCAMIAAHHTGKPPKKEGGGRPAAPTIYEQAYAGLGSSELVNWARACMVLEPVGDGFFRLTLSKRGQRACATHPDGTPTRVIWLRHASKGIFWEQEGAPEASEEQGEGSDTPREVGRPSKARALASSNLHEVMAQIPKDGLSARKLGELLHNHSRKMASTVGLATCRGEVIDLLTQCGKVVYDESSNNYRRGPNA